MNLVYTLLAFILATLATAIPAPNPVPGADKPTPVLEARIPLPTYTHGPINTTIQFSGFITTVLQANGPIAAGTPVVINQDGQGTYFNLQGGATYVRVVDDMSLCLAAGDDANAYDGAVAHLAKCPSECQPVSQTQPGPTVWEYTSASRLQLKSQNYCLDLENGNRADGAKVQVWQCDPNNQNQQWLMFPWILQP